MSYTDKFQRQYPTWSIRITRAFSLEHVRELPPFRHVLFFPFSPSIGICPRGKKGGSKIHLPLNSGYLQTLIKQGIRFLFYKTTVLVLRDMADVKRRCLNFLETSAKEISKNTLQHQVNFHNYRTLHLFLTPRKLIFLQRCSKKWKRSLRKKKIHFFLNLKKYGQCSDLMPYCKTNSHIRVHVSKITIWCR